MNRSGPTEGANTNLLAFQSSLTNSNTATLRQWTVSLAEFSKLETRTDQWEEEKDRKRSDANKKAIEQEGRRELIPKERKIKNEV